ncbi:MAG: alpha/beta hydrolase [Candidatus Zixiibacteriota bacterium]
MDKLNITQKTVRVNGINIFYCDTGGSQPPMLCLHGRWGRWKTWEEFIIKYRNQYRIIAPDQRGHGLSDKPDKGYAAEDFARDTLELVKTLNCGPVIAVGHSMGGRVAGYFSKIYPESVKALAILDESTEGTGIGSANVENGNRSDDGLTAKWPTPYKSFDDAVNHLKSIFSRETNVKYFQDSLVQTAAGYDYLFSRFAMAEIGRSYRPWLDILAEIECPILLMRATDSWCLSEEVANKMRQVIKNCTYFEIPNSDHMVHVDNPEIFYPQFDKFLNNLT